MSRRALVVVGMVTALMALALPAKACSCAIGDPRDAVADADAAFVGTLLSRRPATDDGGQPDLQTAVFTFSVDEEAKGELPDTVDVYSASNGAACGLEVGQGDTTGLLLYLDDEGVWWSNLCSQMSPEDLRKATAPLPEPNGRGPLRVLVGGSWGEVGHFALDARGRTLGYGFGDHDGARLEVCPGTRRFVELYLKRRGYVVAVRALDSNRVVWESDLPYGGRNDRTYESPVGLACRDRAGSEVMVASRAFGDSNPDHVHSVSEPGVGTLYRGKLRDAVFGPDGRVYVQRGERGSRVVEVSSGTVRRVLTVPPGTYGLELSPDGERLAAKDAGEVTVYDLSKGRMTASRDLGGKSRHGTLRWWGNGRVVHFPDGSGTGRVTVLDDELTRARRLDGRWPAWEHVIVGNTAYGLGYGALFRVDLREGPAERVRGFQTYALYSLAGVGGDVRIDW